MLDETFAEALVHKRANWFARRRGFSGHKILGVRLRPFWFWHAACLDLIGSPFLTGGKMPDLGDLVLALFYCRARHPHLPQPVGLSWRFFRFRARIHYSLRIIRLHSAFKKLAKHFKGRRLRDPAVGLIEQAQEIIAFRHYMADYNCPPEYGESENSQPAKTPWYLFSVALTLRLNPRLTLSEAWNSELGLTGWMNAAHMEASGTRIDILTPELRKAFSEVGVRV